MKISIIIPVYNASATLPACLASLESQTYKEMEWLFVDDSSTDESLNILKTYQKRHPELAENMFTMWMRMIPSVLMPWNRW